MFYVCYVLKAEKNAVFPANWLKDHRKQLEKYINSSLNKNQQLLAYYSQEQLDQIENGRSAIDFRPNFQLSMDVDFPNDGCYLVLPKKYFDRFGDAKFFAEHRRNIQPAVYNERRVRQAPAPNVSQGNNINNSLDNSSDDTMNLLTWNTSDSNLDSSLVVWLLVWLKCQLI